MNVGSSSASCLRHSLPNPLSPSIRLIRSFTLSSISANLLILWAEQYGQFPYIGDLLQILHCLLQVGNSFSAQRFAGQNLIFAKHLFNAHGPLITALGSIVAL